ncbi:hypothetical protein D3C78_1039640 [compost metagenome]
MPKADLSALLVEAILPTSEIETIRQRFIDTHVFHARVVTLAGATELATIEG